MLNVEQEIEIARDARVRLDRDLRQAAATLSHKQARVLVDMYYTSQDQRIRAHNQIRAASKDAEPHELLDWVETQALGTETGIKVSLLVYAEAHEVGRWLLSLYGVGPVIAAGLIAHLCEQEPPPHVGHWYSFAGLAPGVKWEKGKKRPWNADLKTLCWKTGQCFMKFSGRDECFYGALYAQRKLYEVAQNDAGAYAEQAKLALLQRNFGKDTEARIWYEGRLTAEAAATIRAAPAEKRPKLLRELAGEIGSGIAMLPPARIQLRAERWAVKMLLAHLHQVAYEVAYDKKAPDPFPFAKLGHADKIEPPGWQSKFGK